MKLLITVRATSLATPNPCQIAATLYDLDWRVLQSIALTIRPDGWEIPRDLSERIGVTTREAALSGVGIRPAMQVLKAMTEAADEWYAFNAPQAHEALAQGMRNAGSPNDWQSRTMLSQCVMRAGSPLVGAKNSEGQDRASTLYDIGQVFRLHLSVASLSDEHGALVAITRELIAKEAFP